MSQSLGMRARTIAGTAFVVIALAIAVVLLVRRDDSPAGPHAVFDQVEHDFGTVQQGAPLSHAFTFRNEGTVPLTISRVELSQPGMKSRFQKVIAPGAEGRITVEWDTSRVRGELAAAALVRLDDPAGSTVTLNLKGSARALVEIEPAPVVFFSVFRDETAEQRVTIVNHDERPLAIERLEPAGTHFVADFETIEPRQRFDVRVTVPKGLTAGRYREALNVMTNHPDHRSLSVGVNVFIKNDVYASPEVVQFDDVSLEQLREPKFAPALGQVVTLRKRQGTFRITSITTDVEGLGVDASPQNAASEAFRLDVSFQGGRTRRGPVKGVVRVATDDKEFPEIIIPVTGTVK